MRSLQTHAVAAPPPAPPMQASYIRDIAQHFHAGRLSDDIIAAMSPEVLMQQLTSIKGVGPWTVRGLC